MEAHQEKMNKELEAYYAKIKNDFAFRDSTQYKNIVKMQQGFDLFLMATPNEDKKETHAISNMNQIYLYKKDNNTAFYYVEDIKGIKGVDQIKYLEKLQLKGKRFNSTKCDNEGLIKSVFNALSEQNHPFPIQKDSDRLEHDRLKNEKRTPEVDLLNLCSQSSQTPISPEIQKLNWESLNKREQYAIKELYTDCLSNADTYWSINSELNHSNNLSHLFGENNILSAKVPEKTDSPSEPSRSLKK